MASPLHRTLYTALIGFGGLEGQPLVEVEMETGKGEEGLEGPGKKGMEKKTVAMAMAAVTAGTARDPVAAEGEKRQEEEAANAATAAAAAGTVTQNNDSSLPPPPAAALAPKTVIALPAIQELGAVPCDTGTDAAELAAEVARHTLPVDLSLVHDGWNRVNDQPVRQLPEPVVHPPPEEAGGHAGDAVAADDDGADEPGKNSEWGLSRSAIAARAREARRWLKARPEDEIVVMSHGGFLHFLTEDWEDSATFYG